jgi:hypothetical protein
MAADFAIPLITILQQAKLFIEAINSKPVFEIRSWNEFIKNNLI